MRMKVKTLMAASLIAAAPAVFAATQSNATETAPNNKIGEMMQDDSGMDHSNGMKNGDMPMMKMMSQMNEMMETCNTMMQTKMEKSKTSGDGSEQS